MRINNYAFVLAAIVLRIVIVSCLIISSREKCAGVRSLWHENRARRFLGRLTVF
jgi:hypothetical protein